LPVPRPNAAAQGARCDPPAKSIRQAAEVISILIPTKNEERDLGDCLKSVAWSDDIHVYDSYSTDRTIEIALAAGARVTRRPDQDVSQAFGGNEAEHRNWGLRNIPFKYPWVFHIDADERVTPSLAASLMRAVEAPEGCVAHRVQRRDFYMDRWLKHVQASPYYIRLFRPDRVRYERLINPVAKIDGAIGALTGFLDHYPFSKGSANWLARHNAYSTFEAQQIVANRADQRSFNLIKAISSPDFNERRFHQKEAFYRLPARPLVKFFLLYVVKRGFLDGRAGFTYAVLQSMYEYMIVLKTNEIAAASAGASRSTAVQANVPGVRHMSSPE
jgi:glycosyltransferase involved in cell wall biosynthesis